MRNTEFIVRDAHGHATTATGRAAHRSVALRWATALAWLAGGIALGAATVVVPIVQFFGPIFFPLAGVWMALVTLQRVERGRVEATCPHCGTPLRLVGAGPSWPLSDDCPACREMLTAEPTEEHASA